MLDINFIRENSEAVKTAINNKNHDPNLVDQVLELDTKRRGLIVEVEQLRSERNKVSKSGDIEKGKQIKEQLKQREPELTQVETEYKELLKLIPNIYSPDTPVGPDESGNKIIRSWGKPPKFDFEPKDHMALGEALDIIDTKTAAIVSGSRFTYLKGDAVLLQFALVQLVMNTLTNPETLQSIAEKVEQGYSNKSFTPVIPPVMIRPEIFDRMSRLKPEDERYYIPSDDVYLIGSAEHTLGPVFMDKTLQEKDLPIRLVGYSTSFRREAGSYGKDIKGILRVHQFDKIEMESFSLAEDSIKEQDFFVQIQEYLLQLLELPYQVVQICTGDMGGPDYRQIDIETWIPSQNKYRETHTSDLMTDYQSRRLNTKVNRKDGTEFVHMNDATAFAIGRTLIAILENYQQKDGSIRIPSVLQPFMNNKEVIKNNE